MRNIRGKQMVRGSYLLDGDIVSLVPLNADPRVQVVQLARAQGDRLVLILECSVSEVFICEVFRLYSVHCIKCSGY